jgi:hypothetical protein
VYPIRVCFVSLSRSSFFFKKANSVFKSQFQIPDKLIRSDDQEEELPDDWIAFRVLRHTSCVPAYLNVMWIHESGKTMINDLFEQKYCNEHNSRTASGSGIVCLFVFDRCQLPFPSHDSICTTLTLPHPEPLACRNV